MRLWYPGLLRQLALDPEEIQSGLEPAAPPKMPEEGGAGAARASPPIPASDLCLCPSVPLSLFYISSVSLLALLYLSLSLYVSASPLSLVCLSFVSLSLYLSISLTRWKLEGPTRLVFPRSGLSQTSRPGTPACAGSCFASWPCSGAPAIPRGAQTLPMTTPAMPNVMPKCRRACMQRVYESMDGSIDR